MKKNRLALSLMGVALIIGTASSAVAVASAASTDTSTISSATTQDSRPAMTPPAAMGKVTAISGSTITITDEKSNTTYTIDASNAAVTKDRDTASTLSDIKVGDMIGVDGTISGTSVTATAIHDGFASAGGPGGGRGGFGGGVMGTVSAINGSTLTVTAKDGGTYTVDASSATVKESGTTSTVSAMKVGDTVMIQGSVTTASMTAKNIEDGVPTRPTQTTTTTQS